MEIQVATTIFILHPAHIHDSDVFFESTTQ